MSPLIVEFEKVLRKRWMVRIRAPSAGHLQPWDFIIIKNAQTKKRIAKAALNQSFIEEAPVVIVVCANRRRSATRYAERGVRFYSLIDTAFASLTQTVLIIQMRNI